MTIKERYHGVIEWFKNNMPVAESELKYNNPFELLVAVILSAQCTDKRVNMTTPTIFRQYGDAESMSKASQEDIYELIKSISYPNNKAKNLLAMAKMLHSEFNGIVPEDLEALQKLPGVGRKTANVVGAVIFNKFVMPVDTHVFRVARRIGLTIGAKTPLQAETQLTKHIPGELLPIAHHWLILHGRYVCTARKPNCAGCGIKKYCKSYSKLNSL